MSVCELDSCVAEVVAALRKAKAPSPDALVLSSIGRGALCDRMRERRTLGLAEIAGLPAPWSGQELEIGKLGELAVWILDDVGADPSENASFGLPWTSSLPVWIAASARARILVHASAGASLAMFREPEEAVGGVTLPSQGALALLRDHLNLSGRTPLVALGASKLGPMFPDQTTLHDRALRELALSRARELGIEAFEAVAACVAGPTLETPAERTFLARAGADVSVQGIAPPLLAAAHAGLAVLAITVVAETGSGPADVSAILAAAERGAPALEELLVSLAPDLKARAKELGRS